MNTTFAFFIGCIIGCIFGVLVMLGLTLAIIDDTAKRRR